jgi:hypothetical protein
MGTVWQFGRCLKGRQISRSGNGISRFGFRHPRFDISIDVLHQFFSTKIRHNCILVLPAYQESSVNTILIIQQDLYGVSCLFLMIRWIRLIAVGSYEKIIRAAYFLTSYTLLMT